MLTFYKQTHTNTRTQAHAFSLQPFNRLLISIWYCVLAVTSKSSCIRFCWAVFNRQTYWKTLCLFNHGHTHTTKTHIFIVSLPLSAVIVRSLQTFVFAKANCYCCYFYAHKIRQNKTWWWRDENGVRNIAETALTLLCWFMDCRCFSFVTALHGCTHA